MAADAYVVVKTADERWESTAVEGTSDPVWPEGEFGDLFVYDHEQRVWACVFDHDGSGSNDFVGASKDICLREALGGGAGPLPLSSREHAEEEEPGACGELTLGFSFLEFVPGELCGDKHVLCVKVETVSLPPECGGRVQLVATLLGGEGEAGARKATPLGGDAVEHEGSLAVGELLTGVVMRAGAPNFGLSVDDIAEIADLDREEVVGVLQGGEVGEQAVVAKTRRVVRLDSCLFLLLPAESLHAASLELAVAGRKGRVLASTKVALREVAEAEGLTLAELHAMRTDVGAEVNAHVSLILMGTREASSLE